MRLPRYYGRSVISSVRVDRGVRIRGDKCSKKPYSSRRPHDTTTRKIYSPAAGLRRRRRPTVGGVRVAPTARCLAVETAGASQPVRTDSSLRPHACDDCGARGGVYGFSS